MRSKKDQKIYDKTRVYLLRLGDREIENKMKIVSKVLEIKEAKDRYDYLYDLLCDYLDDEFKKKNICDFQKGICKRRCAMIDEKIKKATYQNGCCYSYKKGETCTYLDPFKGCQIKNLACKLFTCSFLRKRGYHYSLNQIYLARYFFNLRQKFYLEHTYFVDKEIVLNGVLKRSF